MHTQKYHKLCISQRAKQSRDTPPIQQGELGQQLVCRSHVGRMAKGTGGGWGPGRAAGNTAAQESERKEGEGSEQRDVELGDTAFSTPHAEV